MLSDDHLRAIGAAIVNWNAIEIVMEVMILGLYEVAPNRGLVLTANISFQNKLTILRILSEQGAIQNATEAKALSALLVRIEEAHKKRNTVVCMAYGPKVKAEGLASRMAIRVRGRRLTTVNEQVSLAEAEAIATEFLDLWLELGRCAVKLGVRPELAPLD